MKSSLVSLLLASLLSFTAQGQNLASGQKNQPSFSGNLNSILIYNHTDKNVAYQMVEPSIFPDKVYQIPMGEYENYRSKFSDDNVAVMVGICSDMGYFSCNDYDKLSFVRCTPHKTYNANQVRSIDITTLSTCNVTCLDGTTTSCVVKQ